MKWEINIPRLWRQLQEYTTVAISLMMSQWRSLARVSSTNTFRADKRYNWAFGNNWTWSKFFSWISEYNHTQHRHGPLARYVPLRVAHAPGMPGTFPPRPRVSDPDRHHGMCVRHVPWCMPGSLTCGFLLIQWRGKRFWHSRGMRNPQFCVSGKRPIRRLPFGRVWYKYASF